MTERHRNVSVVKTHKHKHILFFSGVFMFQSKSVPSMSVEHYLQRYIVLSISSMTHIPLFVLVFLNTLVYLERQW